MAKISNYLCDIGSTRVKIYNNGEINYILSAEFKPELIISNEAIYYSNVNPKFTEILKNLHNWIDIGTVFITDTKYKWLGTDRRLAIYNIQDGIAVDYVTAITVDVVKNNKHEGGYIFLGLKKYFDEVKNSFPHINFDMFYLKDGNINICDCENLFNLPNSSACAIICGYISQIIILLKELNQKYDLKILLTGGDAELFIKYIESSNLKYQINLNKNVIFNNMIDIILKSKEKGLLKNDALI